MEAIGTHDVPDLKALPAAVWHIEGWWNHGRAMPWGALVIAPPDGCNLETKRLILEEHRSSRPT